MPDLKGLLTSARGWIEFLTANGYVTLHKDKNTGRADGTDGGGMSGHP